MRPGYQFKINFTGGIVSPGQLQFLLNAIKDCGIKQVRFGLRQQMLIDVLVKDKEKVATVFQEKNIAYQTAKDDLPNIVSSYPAEEIFIKDTWLSEGVYKDIFDLFDYKPTLKINICDHNQTFTPFFTGNINWVASPASHFWYLFIRFPKSSVIYQWPQLIYSNDLPKLSKQIEKIIFDHPALYYDNNAADGNSLYKSITSAFDFISKPQEAPLQLPAFKLPYYEGFNSDGNKWWLGIYRRDELFAVDFLIDVCNICLQTKVGQLYTTPWKSLIIKGIAKNDHHLWDYVLGKYRINVRHASNELNWQVEDTDDDGLKIKQHIIRYFDKEDVRTFGLCFAIKTQPKSGVFGSVVIKRQYSNIRNRMRALDKFEIFYTHNFNPNSTGYMLYRSDVSKENLGVYLISLCKEYYELKSKESVIEQTIAEPMQLAENAVAKKIVYQCTHCLSVYDEAMGEPAAGIAPGTLLNQLPESYGCILCEAPIKDFKAVEEQSLGLPIV